MPRHVVPPPLLAAGFFGAGLGLQKLFRVPVIDGRWALPLSVLVASLGVGLAGAAVIELRRARTAVLPHGETTELVTAGPYRLSRNPIYLGLTLLYVAGALALRVTGPLLWVPFFLLTLHLWVVRREEEYLESLFGERYQEYTRRVRRWF